MTCYCVYATNPMSEPFSQRLVVGRIGVKRGTVRKKQTSRLYGIHQKLNGTLSQRTPDQVSCDRAIRYSGLGVHSVGRVGDFLDASFFFSEKLGG